MTSATNRQAWLAAAVAFVLFAALAPVRSRDGRSFQMDEAHKISETHFLRLFLSGDVHAPEWFRFVLDRTNPPVGKYIFGASILLHGLPLPPAPSLASVAPDGQIPAFFPRETNARYAKYLVPCRRAALAATALTAALLVWCAMRLHGLTAAAAALLLFTFHDVTRGWGGIAVFDPLIALAAMAVAPPVWALWRDPARRSWPIFAVVAGVICGLAIGVRLNGVVALVFAVAALLVTFVRHRSRATLGALILVILMAAIVLIAVNPYYWAAAPGANDGLPLRVVHRFQEQLRDLRTIMRGLERGHILIHGPVRRLGFFGLTLFGGAVGTALWLAVSVGTLLPVIRGRVTDDLRFFWVWAVVIAGATALWLPVPFQRYLMIAIAPLALIAGIGVSELGHVILRSGATKDLGGAGVAS